MKKCPRCKIEKLFSEFNKCRTRKDGHSVYCKKCTKIKDKEYRNSENGKCYIESDKYRESHRKANKKYRSSNQDKIKEYRSTDEYRVIHNRGNRKYKKTERGKEAVRRQCKRYREKYPEKVCARHLINNSVASGKTERPNHCTVCFKECTPEGHHEDYTKPLEVVWLCSQCHNNVHNEKLCLIGD